MYYSKCSRCNGRGWIGYGDEERKCPECHGTGDRKPKKVWCSKCHGSGKMVPNGIGNTILVTCDQCNGTGTVSDDE